MSEPRLYNIMKALSLKEKMVLFYLFKENKKPKQVSEIMKIDLSTVYRIKDRVFDEIMKSYFRGDENV